MATWRDRITVDPAVHHGEPVIRGTRVSVSVLIGSLAEGDSIDQLLASYPQLTRDDVAELLTPRHAELALELRALRPWAKERYSTYEERRDFFRRLVTERLA